MREKKIIKRLCGSTDSTTVFISADLMQVAGCLDNVVPIMPFKGKNTKDSALI